MTRVRQLDVNHDWLFGKGQNDYAQANAAISQDIDTRLECFLGDCFFDLGAGIDWFNLLGGKDRLSIELAVAATILNTAGVTSMVNLTSTLDAERTLFLSYKVTTVYSTVAGLKTFRPPQPVTSMIGLNQGGGVMLQEDADLLLYDM